MDWKPIETAPKDGSTFMVWGYYSELLGAQPSADTVAWGVGTMKWSDTTHHKFEDAGGGLYRKVEMTAGYFGSAGGGYSSGVRPTHWAPLPDGPRVMLEPKGLLGLVA